jgi:hypothetical protein
MLKGLENLLNNALRDRHTGLWAVGDMTWELGMERDPARLLNTSGAWKRCFTSIPRSAASASTTPIRCLARYCAKACSFTRRSSSTRRSHSSTPTTSIPKSAPTNRITASISTQPSPDSASQATSLRHSLGWRRFPNALAIDFGPPSARRKAISIAVFPKWISLFFLQAQKASTPLPYPEKKLQGSGNVVKHISLPSAATLGEPAIRTVMREAEARAAIPLDPKGKHRLIIKSVSAKQRTRRPA